MLVAAAIWSVLVPGAVALGLLLVGRPWTDGEGGVRRAWAVPLAVAGGYVAGNWGFTGGPTGGDVLNARMIYLAVAAAAVALLELRWTTMPAVVRWLLRAVASTAVAWLLVAPLVEPQQWGATQVAARMTAIAGAALLSWAVLSWIAAREPGRSLALGLLLLGTGGSVVLVLSGLTSGGQLVGTLVSTVGASLVVCWRWPVIGRLRGAAGPVALLFVAHLGAGLLYAEMPPGSFALLAVAPLALLVSRVPLLQRLAAVVGLVARLTAIALPVGSATTIAAAHYFGGEDGVGAPPGARSPAARPGSEPDDDYGYD